MDELPKKEDVLTKLKNHRAAGETIVFTNGCFDILHIGHLRYLKQAKALGAFLVVGLNSDASVRRIKGSERPIVPEEERMEMLLGLEAVDYVCLFEEDTPLELIKQIEPNVLVKGGDWSVEQIVGADYVQSIGGSVQSLPFVEGHSTTSILERIR